MAVELDYTFCVTENCKNFRFSETTGAYNVVDNINGWGTPNEATSVATAATFTIKDEEAVTLSTYNLYSTGLFPNTNSAIYKELTSSSFNAGTNVVLPDGVYYGTYNVTTPVGTIPKTKAIFIYCSAKTCVYNMFKDARDNACNCSDEALDNAMKAEGYFQALLNAAACNQIESFKNYLTLINNLCDGGPCDC